MLKFGPGGDEIRGVRTWVFAGKAGRGVGCASGVAIDSWRENLAKKVSERGICATNRKAGISGVSVPWERADGRV